MMMLKYPEPAVRPQEVPSQGTGLFTLPPQGAAAISQTDAQADGRCVMRSVSGCWGGSC